MSAYCSEPSATSRQHGVEPIVLEGVGHFLMLDAPERFNVILTETLATFEA